MMEAVFRTLLFIAWYRDCYDKRSSQERPLKIKMLQFIELSRTLGRNVPETGTAAPFGPQTPEKAESEICETVINLTILSPTVLHFQDARPKRP